LKKVGEKIEVDEAVLEIATDKVDSEIPSEVSGVLSEILFNVDDIVKVGQTIAIIETEGGVSESPKQEIVAEVAAVQETIEVAINAVATLTNFSDSDKFFSPLVKNIAKQEGISISELESLHGSGKEGRVTKEDILNYIKSPLAPKGGIQSGGKLGVSQDEIKTPNGILQQNTTINKPQPAPPLGVGGLSNGDEIIEMDRMRKLISGYMMASINTSAHVQSFIEVDVTNIWKWREKNKNAFEKREGEKLTFTPIFMEAVAKALKDFPGMNISVDGDYIIKKKNINLGMAASLPNGNLIVPVIKNADQLNLVGMAKAVNDLGNRAKAGKLKPDDTQGGTYTVTNVGTFGSVFGTPIINQPQVGILALGAIRKVPAVIETPEGDFIGIRNKMFLSHSYDHRVVDGALGGSFVKRVADYLEAFDVNREF
jgi:2-oxoglutarate dehydrogenase E2 component (dihydrolipoamide succinyltransferase)